MLSRSVVSDSLWPHGEKSLPGYSPWDSPGKSTGVGCHFLLQGDGHRMDFKKTTLMMLNAIQTTDHHVKKRKLWKRSRRYTSTLERGHFCTGSDMKKGNGRESVFFFKLYIFHNCKHERCFNLSMCIFILYGWLTKFFKRTTVIQISKFCSHNPHHPPLIIPRKIQIFQTWFWH